ncbi:MAG: DUF2461 domain-containing protein [Pseudomonadota bacterium]
MADPAFTGFGKDAIKYLKALAFHQDREWFHANKKLYESDVKKPLAAFVESTSEALDAAGLPLRATAKASLFRINRDIRFSKDKSPYQEHVSGVFTRTGTKKDTGGIYFQLGPKGSFMASGLWFPDPPVLKAFREAIVAREKEWTNIVDDLEAKGLPFGTSATTFLKRMPPAFKDVEGERMQEWMKRKGFVVERPVKATRITSPKLIDDVVAFAHEILPFMQFVWRATDKVREDGERKTDR